MEHDHEALQPHAMCLLGDPGILHGMLWSNLGIALAYLLIPLGLQLMRPAMREFDARASSLYPEIDPRGLAGIRNSLLLCFQVFIVACSSTHIFNAVTLYWAFYTWSLVSHVLTAAISLSVAVAMLLACWRIRRS